MTVSLEWPAKIKLFQRGGWILRETSLSSGRGLDGREQVISGEARHWSSTFVMRDAYGAMGRYLWPFLDEVRGKSTPFLITIDNHLTVQMPFGIDTSEPVAAVNSPVGATITTLSGELGLALSPGAFFTFNGWAHRVKTNTDGVISFSPPLREALTSGDIVKVSRPKIAVKFEEDQDAEAISGNTYGQAIQFNVVEAFDR